MKFGGIVKLSNEKWSVGSGQWVVVSGQWLVDRIAGTDREQSPLLCKERWQGVALTERLCHEVTSCKAR